jgi:hypothetical protein
LEELQLREMKIGDELMKEICEMIDPLMNVRELNLEKNDLYLSALSSLVETSCKRRKKTPNAV